MSTEGIFDGTELNARDVLSSALRKISDPLPWLVGLIGSSASTAITVGLRYAGVLQAPEHGHRMGIGPALIAMLVSGVAYSLTRSAVIVAVAERAAGRPRSNATWVGVVLRTAPAQYVSYVVVTLLSVIGYALCFVPGVFVSIAFFLSSACVVLERAGPWRALSRSAELVRWHRTTIAILLGSYCVAILVPLVVGVALLTAFLGVPESRTDWLALLLHLQHLDTPWAITAVIASTAMANTVHTVLATATYLELAAASARVDPAALAREFA